MTNELMVVPNFGLEDLSLYINHTIRFVEKKYKEIRDLPTSSMFDNYTSENYSHLEKYILPHKINRNRNFKLIEYIQKIEHNFRKYIHYEKRNIEEFRTVFNGVEYYPLVMNFLVIKKSFLSYLLQNKEIDNKFLVKEGEKKIEYVIMDINQLPSTVFCEKIKSKKKLHESWKKVRDFSSGEYTVFLMNKRNNKVIKKTILVESKYNCSKFFINGRQIFLQQKILNRPKKGTTITKEIAMNFVEEYSFFTIKEIYKNIKQDIIEELENCMKNIQATNSSFEEYISYHAKRLSIMYEDQEKSLKDLQDDFNKDFEEKKKRLFEKNVN